MSDTTLDLINRVKMKQSIPDSAVSFDEATLLNYLDQALKAYIVPAIEATIEEYFVNTIDFVVPQFDFQGASPVDKPNAIAIPDVAGGMRLRDVYLLNNDGQFYNLPRLTPTQAAAQSWGNAFYPIGINNQQYLGGFFVQGNAIQIFPYGLASGKTVRLTYYRAPNDLALTSDCGQVLAVAGDTLTLDNTPLWTSGVTQVDVISGTNPHDFVVDTSIPVPVYATPSPLSKLTLVSAASNVVVLPVGKGANVQVGDWVCPTGTAAFAMNIPKEILPALVQRASADALQASGDSQGYNIAVNDYMTMINQALKQISPRVVGKPTKLLATNSPFRASRTTSWGRW